MGGGSTSSDSSSRPLNAQERSELYQAGIKNVASLLPGMFKQTTTPASGSQYLTRTDVDGNSYQVENPDYRPASTSFAMDAPQYEAPGYQSPGAFRAGGYTAGIDYAKSKDMDRLNSDLAKRGVWSSGLAQKAVNDLNASYAGAYEKAGADQATAENSYNLQNSGTQNTFNLQNASAKNQNSWRPLEYLQGIWNGTGGAISSGSSGGFNFNI